MFYPDPPTLSSRAPNEICLVSFDEYPDKTAQQDVRTKDNGVLHHCGRVSGVDRHRRIT